MKAALITEEQIKAIEDALGRSVPVVWTNKDQADRHVDALAIVKSLKVSEPVLFKQANHDIVDWDESDLYPMPLYAKEQP